TRLGHCTSSMPSPSGAAMSQEKLAFRSSARLRRARQSRSPALVRSTDGYSQLRRDAPCHLVTDPGNIASACPLRRKGTAMSAQLVTSPDPTRDTRHENDRPPAAGTGRPARLGDSMTLTLGGDRIKVTVLEFVDPAVVDNPGLDTLFDRLADGAASGELVASPEEPRDVRYAAVQVKTRNLDPAIEGSACIVHVALSGFLIDADGNEHSAGMASIKGGGRATPPQRGEPSAIGSIAFRLPNGAVPRSFVLSYSGARKAQWSLEVDAAVDVDAPGATEAPLDVLRQGVGRWNEWRE